MSSFAILHLVCPLKPYIQSMLIRKKKNTNRVDLYNASK